VCQNLWHYMGIRPLFNFGFENKNFLNLNQVRIYIGSPYRTKILMRMQIANKTSYKRALGSHIRFHSHGSLFQFSLVFSFWEWSSFSLGDIHFSSFELKNVIRFGTHVQIRHGYKTIDIRHGKIPLGEGF
jgi:hypothetical protein